MTPNIDDHWLNYTRHEGHASWNDTQNNIKIRKNVRTPIIRLQYCTSFTCSILSHAFQRTYPTCGRVREIAHRVRLENAFPSPSFSISYVFGFPRFLLLFHRLLRILFFIFSSSDSILFSLPNSERITEFQTFSRIRLRARIILTPAGKRFLGKN